MRNQLFSSLSLQKKHKETPEFPGYNMDYDEVDKENAEDIVSTAW